MDMPVKLLVCGSRKIGKTSSTTPIHLARKDTEYASRQRTYVYDYLSRLHDSYLITQIIGGDEGGAERLGLHWARMNNVPGLAIKRLKLQPTKSEKFIALLTGRSPSPRRETMLDRNQRMLAETQPDLVVAFGNSVTTGQLIQNARDLGIDVLEVEVPINRLSMA